MNNKTPTGKERGEITSKYIKVKHPRWGLVDEHRAVMQDHLGRRLSRYEVVHHINDNKHDNRLENLEVMSLSEHSRMHMKANPNIRVISEDEKRKLRELNSGEGSATAKFTNAQAALVLAMKGFYSQREIAEMFGVSHSCIGRIHTGRTYKDAANMRLLPA